MDFYRIVTLTEGDLDLIHGAPEARRAFIDQAIMCYDPSHADRIRDLRHCVEQRNVVIQRANAAVHEFDVWTEQLFFKSLIVQEIRRTALAALEDTVRTIIADYFDTCVYYCF